MKSKFNKMRVSVSFKFLPIILVSFIFINACAQKPATNSTWNSILFYNVENLFDTIDDPLKDDAEFLPGTKSDWNTPKYKTKIAHIGQVIEKANFPVIIGFSEVENDAVLADLVNSPTLASKKYGFVHFDSPDERGIDVALLYRTDLFSVKTKRALPVVFPTEPTDKTRDVLYVSGTLGGETVHVFVNHWPSRSEGEEKTRHRRAAAGSVVRHTVDSLFKANKDAQIVIMGDLNDHPTDESVTKALGALNSDVAITPNNIYNLADRFAKEGKGTHKYKGEWGTLDQLIVSSGFLAAKGIYTKVDAAHVAEFDFLLEPDTRGGGMWTKRTYAGTKYLDGYSDHLPVYLELYKK
jgi:predicted extracellular nuclease